MRVGEALILLALTVGTPLAILRPLARGRRWLALGLAISLATHGLIEGLRWQMVPAYALLISLAAGATLLPRGVRRGRVALALASLLPIGLSAYLGRALPVFALPTPTGPHAVGVRYATLVDPRRADPFLRSPAPHRTLRIKTYYPALPDAAKPTLAYFRGALRHLRAFAAFYNVPPFAFDHLALVRTHGKEGLTPIDAPAKLPVALFSHGAGAGLETETALCEGLASHGYVVVAVDHPFVSAATALDDRLIDAHEANVDFHVSEPAEPITRIMADDDRFVLDALGRGEGVGPLRDRLELRAVGIVGHSVGGAAAYRLALTDPRVRAAVNLDGVVYVAPGAGQRAAPTLMLANDRYHVQAIEAGESLAKTQTPPPTDADGRAYLARAERNARGLRETLRTSGGLYTIVGSDHMKFTDQGLYIGDPKWREALQIGGATEPGRCLEIATALTAAFLDQHLKRGAASGVDSLTARYPELRRIRL